MKLVGTLLAYALTIGTLFAGLIGGVTWLVQPGPAISRQAHSAPIPPRIADSIERKKPIAVKEAAPEPAKPAIAPAMTEANVSLAPAPSFKIRERAPAPHRRKPQRERGVAQAGAPEPIPAARSPLPTARSDFPY